MLASVVGGGGGWSLMGGGGVTAEARLGRASGDLVGDVGNVSQT